MQQVAHTHPLLLACTCVRVCDWIRKLLLISHNCSQNWNSFESAACGQPHTYVPFSPVYNSPNLVLSQQLHTYTCTINIPKLVHLASMWMDGAVVTSHWWQPPTWFIAKLASSHIYYSYPLQLCVVCAPILPNCSSVNHTGQMLVIKAPPLCLYPSRCLCMGGVI